MWQLKSNDLCNERLLLEESLFTIGNGYVGIRGCFEEAPELMDKTIRGSYINGYYDRIPVIYSESAYGFPTVQDKQPRIMDTQTALVFLDGEPVVINESKIRDYYRVLDLQKGILERGYRYITKNGKTAKLSFKRLASFTIKNLLCYEIDVEFDGDIEIISLLDSDVKNHSDASDPRVATGHEKLLGLQQLFVAKDIAFCEMETITSKISLLCGVKHMLTSKSDEECHLEHIVEDQRICTKAIGRKHLSLYKKCVFVDGIRTGDIHKETLELFAKYDKYTFDDFARLQKAYLDSYWERSDIQIYGCQKVQEAIRFQLFHLLQSIGKDEISNISAKGLTGEGYEGHYFWDTEIYVLPLFQLTQPELAKQLLLYRYRTLPQAKKQAEKLGHKRGAAYPWRTISGIECSSYFPAGTAQYHINADIAYGFIQYYQYHKDKAFMLEAAAEVIFETARIWLEIGHWHKGAYHINNVTGPDEYTAIVNNNFYTNAMAKYHMHWANKLYIELKEYNPVGFKKLCQKIELSSDEVNDMRLASEAMFLPYNKELGIHEQDDSFLSKDIWDFANTTEEQHPLLLHFHPLTIYRYQVLKQADTVLSHFLLEEYADLETVKRSFDYYEKITTHDSSLSSCIYGIMASRCGYNDKAYDYFMESVRMDLDDTQGNTKDGLHMANLAGSCLGIINGFAGYRIKENGISIAPILPKQFEGYSFRIHYLDSWLEIKVAKLIHIRLLKGNPTKIKIYDCEYIVEDTIELGRK
ncbi:MAG: glycoside hydrolase family 65 [Clostridia bacterium]|jgi:alpha,alpha-trehalose phosphorylase|nr:glycoside hydrolase family 65 [Clostridia bacterium]